MNGAQSPALTSVARVTRTSATVGTRRVGQRDPVTRAISYPHAFLCNHHKQYIRAFSPSLALFRMFWNVPYDASTLSSERDRHSQFPLARSSIKHQTQACCSPKLHSTSQEPKIIPEPSCIFVLRCVVGHAMNSLPPVHQCRPCRSPQARARPMAPERSRRSRHYTSCHPAFGLSFHPILSSTFPSFPANLLATRRRSRHVARCARPRLINLRSVISTPGSPLPYIRLPAYPPTLRSHSVGPGATGPRRSPYTYWHPHSKHLTSSRPRTCG